MKQVIPSTLRAMLVKFAPMFTVPSLKNFMFLTCGWMMCIGRHCITRVIQFGSLGEKRRHHAAFYRFLTRARWEVGQFKEALVPLVLQLIPGMIYLLVDESLTRRGGPHIWGIGMHYDPLNSSYKKHQKGEKKKQSTGTAFACGHSWVILSIYVPFPWNPQRGIALPVSSHLYLSKKTADPKVYQKRTQIARSLVDEVLPFLPSERQITLLGDGEYSCKTVIKELPERVSFIGPMVMDAAFYTEPENKEEGERGRGRPRKVGERLLSPQQLATDESIPWEEHTVFMYRREVTFLTKTQVGLWYNVVGSRLCKMVVTRDPTGRIDDRAYVCTDSKQEVCDIAIGFSKRWCAEVMHRDCKQHLGLGEPQNGWWRSPKGQRPEKKPGIQSDDTRGNLAVSRTVPMILTVYVLVVLWYFQEGCPKEDVERVRKRSPWYRHKEEPSFADMLSHARCALFEARIFEEPLPRKGPTKITDELMELVMAA